jgi:hypothetical protein
MEKIDRGGMGVWREGGGRHGGAGSPAKLRVSAVTVRPILSVGLCAAPPCEPWPMKVGAALASAICSAVKLR